MKESTPQSESKHPKRVTVLRRLSSSLAVLLAVAVTVTSINRGYSVEAQVRATPYDGATLYRGLFFASGPVASKVPTIRKLAPYFPAEYKSLEGQITKYIQAKDPKFFDNFAKDIQSGDRVRVAEAIKRTNKLQKEALLEVTKNSRTQFATQVRRLKDQEPDQGGLWWDFAVAAETEAAVAIIFFVLILVFWAKPPAELKGLSFERYVDEIVRAVPKA